MVPVLRNVERMNYADVEKVNLIFMDFIIDSIFQGDC